MSALLKPPRGLRLRARRESFAQGAVYSAEHKESGTPRLVLSRASAPADDRDEVWLHMARASKDLEHENVCRIFDIEIRSDRIDLIAEHLEGLSVRALVDGLRGVRRRLVARHALYLCSRVLSAVQAVADIYPAASGWALRPDDFFIRRDGVVKMLPPMQRWNEFILADTREVYAAPEQILGQPGDQRSLVFAVGLVLAEIVSGRPLVRRESAFCSMTAIVEGDLNLGRCERAADGELWPLLRRATERDPEKRWQSIDEMVCELNKICEQLKPATEADMVRYVEVFERIRHERRVGPSAAPKPADEGPPAVESTAIITKQGLSRLLDEAQGMESTGVMSRARVDGLLAQSCVQAGAADGDVSKSAGESFAK